MQRRVRLALVVFFVAVTSLAATAPADPLWDTLMAGYAKYVEGTLLYSHLRPEREATREHQKPPVTVLSCSDSRVPPELIFDQTVGDLFVVRVAGNVVDTFNLASIEYAIAKGYTKMIVVMGHEHCGAVEAALSGKRAGSSSLRALVARINANLGGRKPPIHEAVVRNAQASARQLLSRSSIVREAVNSGKVQLVTAYYSFDGKVERILDK